MSEPTGPRGIGLADIAATVQGVMEDVRNDYDQIKHTHLAALIDELSLSLSDATVEDLLQILALLHEQGELPATDGTASDDVVPLQVLALILVLSPARPVQTMFTEDEVNTLCSMAAQGKITGIVGADR